MASGSAGSALEGSTRTSLIAALKSNRAGAWDRLVQLYAPLVYGWLRRAGVPASDAPDISQEVFRSVFANIARFRLDRPTDTFRGWLWTITRSKIVDWQRTCAREPKAPGGSTFRDYLENIPDLPVELDSSAIERATVRKALAAVKDEVEPRTWEAFRLLVMEDRAARDVACELKIKIGAVYTAKSRILARLRQILGDQAE